MDWHCHDGLFAWLLKVSHVWAGKIPVQFNMYFRYTQPLFIQSLMGLKGLYDSKLVTIYVQGKPAEGDLKRPFKGAGGLLGGA